LCVGVRHIHPALFNSCSLLCSAAITLVQISAQTVRERYNEGAFDNEPRYQQGRTIARAVTRGNKSQGGQEYPLFISRYFCGWCAMNFVAVGTWFSPIIAAWGCSPDKRFLHSTANILLYISACYSSTALIPTLRGLYHDEILLKNVILDMKHLNFSSCANCGRDRKT
jgi:hypothetical protein